MHYSFDVTTDHFQVLFGDRQRGPYVDTTALWISGQQLAMLEEEPYVVGLGTVRYGGQTRIEVDVVETPEIARADGQLIGRFSLNVPSGELVFWGPEAVEIENAPSVSLHAGEYSGAAFSRGTESVRDEMADEGADVYCIALWPKLGTAVADND